MKPKVAVVGAGISGLAAIQACIARGLPYVAFEKADDVGGTWRDNVYPGLSVDSPGATYQFPFAPKWDWQQAYASGPEVQGYIQETAGRLRLKEGIRFSTEVLAAEWTDGRWHLTTSRGPETADVLVMATGFLRVPNLPRFDGSSSFDGPSFHSSAWPVGLDVRGKRVGIVGMGSTGIQLVTRLSQEPCEVVQIVRHPQWVHTTPNRRNSAIRRWVYRTWPSVGQRAVAHRLDQLRNSDPRMTKHGDWRRFRGPGRDLAYQAFADDLNQITDPELRAVLTPDDLPGCKRTPLAPGYYRAVQQNNVQVVRSGIRRIVPAGVVTEDEQLHELDILVYATGFDTHAYFRPTTIKGLDGKDLAEEWTPGPYTYRGIMVPRYPNLFVLHGPYTPVNNISVPLGTHDMVEFTMRAVDFIAANNVAVAPTAQATEDYLTWVRSALPATTWAGDCNNWYKAADGHALIWPFSRDEHLAMYAKFDPEHCETFSTESHDQDSVRATSE